MIKTVVSVLYALLATGERIVVETIVQTTVLNIGAGLQMVYALAVKIIHTGVSIVTLHVSTITNLTAYSANNRMDTVKGVLMVFGVESAIMRAWLTV